MFVTLHPSTRTVVEAPMRDLVLRNMMSVWQCSPGARQAIGASQTIPRRHTYSTGVQTLEYELEDQDLRALFERFDKCIAVPAGASEEEIQCGLAELKVVYRLLRKLVREMK